MKYIIGIIFIINSEVSIEWKKIDTSCQDWWDVNLIIVEKKGYKHMQNRYLHFINNKPVMGYICKQ
jgi:hypothetical protein